MKQIFLFLFLGSFFFANAQYATIDSLQASLTETSTDTVKMEVYLEMGKLYTSISLDTSLYYSRESYDLAKKNDWNRKQIEVLINVGYSHMESRDLDKSFQYFEEALDFAKELKDTFSMAISSNAMGTAFWEKNDKEVAVGYFQKANVWAEQTKNQPAYKSSLNNLGMISGILGRTEQAIQYFEKFVALAEESKEVDRWENIAIGNMNIGVAYGGMEEYEKAIAYYKKALSLKSLIPDQKLIAFIHMNIADALFAQEKYVETLEESNNALAFCEKISYVELRPDLVSIKIKSLLKLKKYEQALHESEEVWEEVEKSNFPDLISVFKENVSKAHEGLGNYKEALYWQKTYSALQDSLHKVNRDAAIAEIEISHQTKEKEAENALLKVDKEVQEAALNHRTWLAKISVLGLIMFGVFSMLLHRARKKLEVMNNDLEGTVAARTEALEQSNEELQQSNEELKRFAFIASHDLKEPLRNTGSFISLMKRRLEENDYESLGEYMTFVEKSNYQMVDLVDNILAYSQLESKKGSKKRFVDINEEVKNVSELLQSMMSLKNAAIFCDPLPKVYCNPYLIKVVLKNLIENGIKYNQSEQPTIRISAERTESHLNLIISDNGIGIPKDYQDKIFAMFVRLNSRSAYTGSGMGLAFCKKMLDNNGEKITVESEEGKGSTFTVTIHAKIVNEDGGADFSLSKEEVKLSEH